MNVLILSASIGSGHTKAAQAVAESLNVQTQIIDFMDWNISKVNYLLKKLYLSILKLIPDLYDRIYRLAGVRQFGSITRLIWSAIMYLPFAKLLDKLQPDIIICTHPFPEAAAALWKFLHPKSAGRFKLAAVLTDFSIHEIWIYNEVDLYFVATEDMKHELEAHGNYKVIAAGIPISKNFEHIQTNHVNKNEYTVLIMGGGLGLGSFESTIESLDKVNVPLKIIVVAGKNERLQSKLKLLNLRHKLEILGFVDNVAQLMQSADLLITKPGALTLSEAFAAGLPIILHSPIPGPEALNAEFAIKNGAALNIENNIADTVSKLLSNADLLRQMRLNSKSLSKVDAAKLIAHNVLN